MSAILKTRFRRNNGIRGYIDYDIQIENNICTWTSNDRDFGQYERINHPPYNVPTFIPKSIIELINICAVDDRNSFSIWKLQAALKKILTKTLKNDLDDYVFHHTKETDNNLKELVEKLKEKQFQLNEIEDTLIESENELNEINDILKESDDKLKVSDDKLNELNDKIKVSDDKLNELNDKINKKEIELNEINEKLKEKEIELNKKIDENKNKNIIVNQNFDFIKYSIIFTILSINILNKF
jgi:septal ring factor EnvC (AmiA/AmiB activator)